MRVKDLRGPGPKTPADRAVFSRSVRRLASRGLVIRCNFRHGVQHGPNTGHTRIGPNDKHTRADHLLLTKLGREIANHLLAEVIQQRFPREEAPPPAQVAAPELILCPDCLPRGYAHCVQCALANDPGKKLIHGAIVRVAEPPPQPAGKGWQSCENCHGRYYGDLLPFGSAERCPKCDPANGEATLAFTSSACKEPG